MGASQSVQVASKTASSFALSALGSKSLASNVVTNYEKIEKKAKKVIENNEKIIQIDLLESPQKKVYEQTELAFSAVLKFWCTMSYGVDGLQVLIGANKNELVERRKNNKVSKVTKIGEYQSITLKTFIQEHEEKTYSVIDWNCQHYAEKLIEAVAAKKICSK